jgi:putative membrane protein
MADGGTRDRLALQRTELANERTLLAYVRTAVALVAAGASSIHFLEGVAVDLIGGALIAAGVLVQLVGFRRYRRNAARLHPSDG